jgi:dTDP-4-amino-4,6-dideoxygalactose transaminase
MNRTRHEFEMLKGIGIEVNNPIDAVEIFEKSVASYCSAPYAISTDSCTHALELIWRYLKPREVTCPRHTYPSVPMTLLKIGTPLNWTDLQWCGDYEFPNLPVVDASTNFSEDLYKKPGTFYALSFQAKKRLPIGRGGMILTDDLKAYEWFKRASWDGRDRSRPWKEQSLEYLGYHYYMPPEDAARGLVLLKEMQKSPQTNPQALVTWEDYPDLSLMPIFQ